MLYLKAVPRPQVPLRPTKRVPKGVGLGLVNKLIEIPNLQPPTKALYYIYISPFCHPLRDGA